jgi:alkylated DNA repair dioxygenase AlkB
MERMPWSPLVRQIRDGLLALSSSCGTRSTAGRDAIQLPFDTFTTTTATASSSCSTRWTPSQCYYDGCLLNLYPDGGSGMRYHVDPDQGTLWDYETAVVSVGASRRVAFREIQQSSSLPTTSSSSPPSTTTKPRQLGDTPWTTTYNTTTITAAVTKHRPSSKPHTFVVLHGDVMEMFGNCQSTYQHTVKTAEDKSEVTPRVSLVFKKTRTTIPVEGIEISQSLPAD